LAQDASSESLDRTVPYADAIRRDYNSVAEGHLPGNLASI